MCGIAGLYAFGRQPTPGDRHAVEAMCDRMRTRGPDGHGIWSADAVVLGHRRLSIIDLNERSAQPMRSEDGQVALTFNGEIYNYRVLRAELEARGCRFRTESDTEVLLQLYLTRGPQMLGDLRGMFAFAVWDGRSGELILARDRFGIKPLYVAVSGTDVRFASEVKALLAGGNVDTSPSAAGHVGFHLWGHVPEPFTLYRGISALPAGSYAVIGRDGAMRVHEYATIALLVDPAAEAYGSNVGEDALREALLDSVRHHQVADVPVGIFLSAGRDSTTLLALAAETGQALRTVTLGFDEYRGTPHDEAPLAEEVARRYGAEHRTIRISRQDFRQAAARLLDRMDQPSIDGVNSYFVAQAAAEAGLKVALSGLGADELFGGYPSFTEVPRLAAAVGRVPARGVLGPLARRVSANVLARTTSSKYAGLLEYGGSYEGAYFLRRGLYMPWELPAILGPDMTAAGLQELDMEGRLRALTDGIMPSHARVSALEGAWYMRNQLLRDTDWASMSHALEVRVPLVDATLWRAVARLRAAGVPADKGAMARAPRPALPGAVLNRPKTGFTVPVREWLQAEGMPRVERGLRSWARQVYRHFA